jgi:hypothetical protein
MGLVLRSEVFECRLTDVHQHTKNFAGEGERRVVSVRHGRARIAANVEALVDCEITSHLFLKSAMADPLLAATERCASPGTELTLFVDFYFRGENMASRRDRLGRRHPIVHLVVVSVLPPADTTSRSVRFIRLSREAPIVRPPGKRNLCASPWGDIPPDRGQRRP